MVAATIGSAEFRTEQPIPLIGIEDLNWHRHAALPVTLHESYQKRRLCVKHTDVNVVVRIPRSGYVPGTFGVVVVVVTDYNS